MNILQMLADLRSERQRLEEAILVIERLGAGGAERRGRPPKWMAAPRRLTAWLSRRRRDELSARLPAKRWRKLRKSAGPPRKQRSLKL